MGLVDQEMKFYRYKAEVTRVVDGDTFYATVDQGFHILNRVKFRLVGIDTPEIYRPKSDTELEHGREAKARVEELIGGKQVTIVSHKTGKYGRWLATVIIEGESQSLTQILIDEGFEKRETYA